MTIRIPTPAKALEGFERLTRRTSPEFLVGLFRSMLRIRRIEEEIERRYHQDQMKTPIHLVIGQEATSVGCCAALRDTDLLYSSHRTHGNYLAKGGDLKAHAVRDALPHQRLRRLPRRLDAPHRQAVGMAGTSAIVGGAVPIATGAALAAQMRGDDQVVVVFHRRCHDRRRRRVREPELRRAEKAAGHLLLREQFLFGAVAARDAPAAARPSQVGGDLRHSIGAGRRRERPRCLRRRGRTPSTARAPAMARPSSKRLSIASARMAAPATTATPATATRQSDEHWEAVSTRSRCSSDYLRAKRPADDDGDRRHGGSGWRGNREAFEFALASPNPTEADLYRHVYAD